VLAHRARTLELETVSIVDKAIEDGIGISWFADEVVPGFDRELAGDQRGGAAMALLDDLHEIAPLAGGEPVGTEIVEQQHRPWSAFGRDARSCRRHGRAPV